MAAFTTYCRFQSAPNQRIRNISDNILPFQRLMAKWFIKTERGKTKTAPENRTVCQRHGGEHSCEREVPLPRVLAVAATSLTHVNIHNNISEVTLPWANKTQRNWESVSGNTNWKGNKSLYTLDVLIMALPRNWDVIKMTNTKEYYKEISIGISSMV